MSAGTADNTAGMIPVKDNALGRAFEELDQKLNAWTAAAVALKERIAAESALKAESGSIAAAPPPSNAKQAAETPLPVEAPKPIPVSRLQEPEQVQRPAAQSAPVEPDIAEPLIETRAEKATVKKKVGKALPTSMDDAPADDPPADDETLLAGLNPERAEAIRARHAFFKGSKTIRELIQEFEDEADDEESLLMSLDPEFAKAVRVKYRLYNGRKTLREVIAEVETSQPKQSQADKKSWWRR